MVVVPIKNKLLQSITYLIGNYIVDCGDDGAILNIAKEQGTEIRGIFLTHCHQDHIDFRRLWNVFLTQNYIVRR